MTCRQIQLIPSSRQRDIACRDNLFQAFFTCRTGDELHIRRMAQESTLAANVVVSLTPIFLGQLAEFLVQLRVLVTSEEAALP